MNTPSSARGAQNSAASSADRCNWTGNTCFPDPTNICSGVAGYS
jgi:hypothetical protein